MTLRVGLTGGIGSGKSTVAKIFETLNIPVYYADESAKHIMNNDEALRKKIIELFGDDAYNAFGLNRAHIAAIVFNDKQKLEQLNSLVHPATISHGENWMLQQTTPYAIKEAALIFESGVHASLDYVIGVSAPVHLRIHRAMKRDNISREEVKARMNRQIDEVIKMRLCDFVIVNDEQHLVIPQVMELHQKLQELAGQ